jgi:putative oxidoreductase
MAGAAQSALRIAAGLAYFSHGAQKFLGWFGGTGGDGGTVELMSRFGAAGIIETVGGALLVLGLFTRPVAFLASGEMAVAYFWMHWGPSGQMWWWENRGEVVMLFSFIWFFFAAAGAGPFSLDAWRGSRTGQRDRGPATTPGHPV